MRCALGGWCFSDRVGAARRRTVVVSGEEPAERAVAREQAPEPETATVRMDSRCRRREKNTSLLASWLLASFALGCAATPASTSDPGRTVEADTARVPQHSPPPEPEPLPEPRKEVPELEVIQPNTVVPAFKLTAEDGTELDSAEIVGSKPFVVLFFASWCGVCERKIPEVKKALADAGGNILVIAVSLDNPDTWGDVAGYVARHDMGDYKLVRGQSYRRFSTAYNPFGRVPIVEVVGGEGIITALQKGWRPAHRDKLTAALEALGSG